MISIKDDDNNNNNDYDEKKRGANNIHLKYIYINYKTIYFMVLESKLNY
jgi:hypothetical protein